MYRHETFTEGDQTIVIVACRSCTKSFSFEVDTASYDKWTKGELIQKALPQVPVSLRELLISGTCRVCFDEMFKEED